MIREEQHLGAFLLPDEAHRFGGGLGHEALDVHSLLLAVEVDDRQRPISVPFVEEDHVVRKWTDISGLSNS